jgi:hypothetical protein
MRRVFVFFCVVASLSAATSADAGTVTYVFEQGQSGYTGCDDTTIFSESENSAGGGDGVFVGANGSLNARRALLRMDLSSIPAGATVQSATLELTVSTTPNATPIAIALHAATRAWGEGSVVPPGAGGAGAAPATGDATWSWSKFNQTAWTAAGGDFSAATSATASAGAVGSVSAWTGAGLAADVQAWVSNPASNFGWVLVGPETTAQRVRKFYSSEAAQFRPRLTVTVLVPSAPVADGWALLVTWLLIGLLAVRLGRGRCRPVGIV